jgi:hypothetical protein
MVNTSVVQQVGEQAAEGPPEHQGDRDDRGSREAVHERQPHHEQPEQRDYDGSAGAAKPLSQLPVPVHERRLSGATRRQSGCRSYGDRAQPPRGRSSLWSAYGPANRRMIASRGRSGSQRTSRLCTRASVPTR